MGSRGTLDHVGGGGRLAVHALVLVMAVAGSERASAATLSVPACVNTNAPLPLTGGGFSPFATVTVDSGTGSATITSADAAGSIAVEVRTPGAPAASAPISASDGVSSAVAFTQVVVPNTDGKPVSAPVGRAIRITGQGFPVGRRVWAHVRAGRRTLWRKRLSVATGPCGAVRATRTFFVHRRGRRTLAAPPGEVEIVVAAARRYSPAVFPRDVRTYFVGTRGIPPRTYRAFALFGSEWQERP